MKPHYDFQLKFSDLKFSRARNLLRPFINIKQFSFHTMKIFSISIRDNYGSNPNNLCMVPISSTCAKIIFTNEWFLNYIE